MAFATDKKFFTMTVKCSDLNKEGTPGLVVTRGSSRRFFIF